MSFFAVLDFEKKINQKQGEDLVSNFTAILIGRVEYL